MRTANRILTAAIAAGLAAAASAFETPRAAGPTWGPPAICHPIDIGDARSLPWGKGGAFAADPKYDLARVVPDAISVLDESDATLVHMETVRRAVLYLAEQGAGAKERNAAWRHEQAELLLARLRERILAAQLEAQPNQPAPGRREALAWFDLGYAQAAFSQIGVELASRGFAELEKAAGACPEDGAMHLGVALGLWQHGGDELSRLAHLERAAALATDAGGPLRRNLMSTAARFMDCENYEQLLRTLRAKLGRV